MGCYREVNIYVTLYHFTNNQQLRMEKKVFDHILNLVDLNMSLVWTRVLFFNSISFVLWKCITLYALKRFFEYETVC